MEANMAQQKQEQSGQPEEDYRHGRRHHHGGISGIGAGVFLLLLGILLFLANQGILAWDKWWQFLIIGIGIILLVDSLIRYQKDTAREIRIGRLIAAIILIGVGIAFLVGNATWWPLIIILVGVAIIVSGLFRRGQSKS
jgi:asparagine N-glycosylation enzyme membrane subunit Stt3